MNMDIPFEIAAKRVQRGKDAGKNPFLSRRLFDDASSTSRRTDIVRLANNNTGVQGMPLDEFAKRAKSNCVIKEMLNVMFKWAKDDDVTKAIFDHFRNIATAVAFVAVAIWISKHREFGKHAYHSISTLFSAVALSSGALVLFWIAIWNAIFRMRKARFHVFWLVALGLFYVVAFVLVLPNLLAYALKP